MAAPSCAVTSSCNSATMTTTTTAPSSSSPDSVNRKTALASAAGTSQPQKHRPTSLRTPLTGTYPSTIHSPSTSFSAFHNIPPTPVSGVLPDGRNGSDGHLHHKANDVPLSATSFGGGRTPLTPPPAYLDFLKAVSPSILPSPLSTGTSVHFSFSATSTVSPGLPVPSSANLSGKWTGREKWPRQQYAGAGGARHGRSTSLSQRPVLSSHVSEESTVSSLSSMDSMDSVDSDMSSSFDRPCTTASTSNTQARSNSDGNIPTSASTFTTTTTTTPPKFTTSTPRTANTPVRRPSIIIPPSPSTSIPIPVSASSLRDSWSLSSPPGAFTTTSASAPPPPSITFSKAAAHSPASASPCHANSNNGNNPRTVSVRQVVTKTVTYNRPHSRSLSGVASGSGSGSGSGRRKTNPTTTTSTSAPTTAEACSGKADDHDDVKSTIQRHPDSSKGTTTAATAVKTEKELESGSETEAQDEYYPTTTTSTTTATDITPHHKEDTNAHIHARDDDDDAGATTKGKASGKGKGDNTPPQPPPPQPTIQARQETPKLLLGEAPRGKRRKVG